FEDYLELERFIAELQAGHATYPPQELTPAQARAYRMAMLFHAATPGVSEPDPEFATRLRARLEQELQTFQKSRAPARRRTPKPLPKALESRRRVPRRWLLAGSVSAAASIALTAGATHMLDMVTHSQSSGSNATATSPVSGQNQEVTVRVTSLME